MNRTLVGQPCYICGKPIGKARLRLAPYANTCTGRCFVAAVIRSMPPWQLEVDRRTHAQKGGRNEPHTEQIDAGKIWQVYLASDDRHDMNPCPECRGKGRLDDEYKSEYVCNACNGSGETGAVEANTLTGQAKIYYQSEGWKVLHKPEWYRKRPWALFNNVGGMVGSFKTKHEANNAIPMVENK